MTFILNFTKNTISKRNISRRQAYFDNHNFRTHMQDAQSSEFEL